MMRSAIALALLVAGAVATADTVHLKNGDQVSGKVAPGTKAYRVQTPYGRLLIPRSEIELVLYDDGRSETPAEAPSAGSKGGKTWHLELIVRGDSFWWAWAPKEAPVDPALRLTIAVDGQPMASYVDRQLDSDIAGAVVNTFAFNPSATSRTLWNQTNASTPETAPGRVTLRLALPAPPPGSRQVALTYQVNLGTLEQPMWTDLTAAEIVVASTELASTSVYVDQSRGSMNFGGLLRKKKMRDTGTFVVKLSESDNEPASADTGAHAPSTP